MSESHLNVKITFKFPFNSLKPMIVHGWASFIVIKTVEWCWDIVGGLITDKTYSKTLENSIIFMQK